MSTIDEVMAKDAEDLTSEDVVLTIKYIRGMLRQYELGVKPKKGEGGPELTLEDIGMKTPTLTRRRL